MSDATDVSLAAEPPTLPPAALVPSPWERAAAPLGRLVRSVRLLLFRPSRFFVEYATSASRLHLALFAWAIGVATVFDRQSVQKARGKELFFSESWSRYWAFAAVVGLLVGAAVYLVGGWWYQVRLWWSRVNPIDGRTARAVYLPSGMIEAVPLLLWTVGETLHDAGPGEVGTPWALVLLVFPIWSIVTSYRGVRTVFTGNRGLMLLWFLVLPLVVRVFATLALLAFIFLRR